MKFSERLGIQPVRDTIQKDSMNDALRNSLWNALIAHYWEKVPQDTFFHYLDRFYNHGQNEFVPVFLDLWRDHFKYPIDEIPSKWQDTKSGLYSFFKDYFFRCEWHGVYDFIEYIARNSFKLRRYDTSQNFKNECNRILERELSAYRFVGDNISLITSEEEIRVIEEAMSNDSLFLPVNLHIKQALGHLSNKTNPDYRNSIKESISAVEAMCKIITKDNKADLNKVLKNISGLHPALKDAFIKLYGYTSDAEGIRHALLDESYLRQEDAQFILVSCSAFVNYLKVKHS